MPDLLTQFATSGNVQSLILLVAAWFLKNALKLAAKYYDAYKEDTIRSSLERQQAIALQEKTNDALQRIENKIEAFNSKLDYNIPPITSDKKAVYPVAN